MSLPLSHRPYVQCHGTSCSRVARLVVARYNEWVQLQHSCTGRTAAPPPPAVPTELEVYLQLNRALHKFGCDVGSYEVSWCGVVWCGGVVGGWCDGVKWCGGVVWCGVVVMVWCGVVVWCEVVWGCGVVVWGCGLV